MDRPRSLALALLSLSVLTPGRVTAQARRSAVELSVQVPEAHPLAGDPIDVILELTTTRAEPVTIHFDRRLISFSLDPGTSRELLCEPPPEGREAERPEFVTVTKARPHRVRIELVRQCPAFAVALSREGPHDLLAYYEARLDGWQFELEAWRGRLVSDPLEFVLAPRFGAVDRGTSVSQRVLVYVDDDHTTVVMPQTAASADVATGLTVGASYMADIVSSASVDIVAAASRRLYERRDQIGLGATYGTSGAVLSSAITYSTEPDFRSEALQVGASHDFLERNVTLSAEYQLRLDRLGVSGDDPLPYAAFAHRGRLDYIQLVDASSFAQLSLSGGAENGYLANPYRYVTIGNMRLPETVPDQLYRGALGLRYARLLASGNGARAEYRYYMDSWGIRSHTAELHYAFRITSVVFRLVYRFYIQNEADFYRGEYEASQRYFTGDREVGGFNSHMGRLEVAWSKEFEGVLSKLGLEGQVGVTRYSYDDNPLQSSRSALTVQLAASAGF